MNDKLLKEILQELKNIHFHMEQSISFYVIVNKTAIQKEEKRIKEIEKG